MFYGRPKPLLSLSLFIKVKGSHGASKHVNIIAFPTIDQAEEYLRNSGIVSIIGVLGVVSCRNGNHNDSRKVEEDPDTKLVYPTETCHIDTPEVIDGLAVSRAIQTRPFEKGDVCFSISKKAGGLTLDQARQCDYFVHIPSPAPIFSNAKAYGYCLVDSQTCLSIVLHHYTAALGFQERCFTGQKFEVDSYIRKNKEQCELIRNERQMRRQEQDDEIEAYIVDLFN